MVHERFVIAPVAGILMLAATANAQENNNTGNSQESSSTGNAQQQSNSTGNVQGSNNTAEQQSADFVNTILAVHNRERAAGSVAPLVWNDTLAAEAKTWAEHLEATGTFEHDTTIFDKGEGENLAGFAPSLGISAPGEGLSLWVNEKDNWHGGPVTAETPFAVWGSSIGHYVQMVSSATTHVGCGTASPGRLAFSVLDCRYDRSLFPQEPYIAPFLSRLPG